VVAQAREVHLPSPIARCRRSTLGVVIGVVVLGCNLQEGALREEPPPNGSAEFCAENQHVEDHACVACPEGLVNAAGDDPSGDDTACSERLGLGAACTESDACDSAHCVDGVCCESACDGPCMDC